MIAEGPVGLTIAAAVLALAIVATVGWWWSARARVQAADELLHSDAHLRAISEALDLAEPERRSTNSRRRKVGKNWRDAVVERARALRRERDEDFGAVRTSSLASDGALTTAVIFRQSAEILASLSDAITDRVLPPRAQDIAGTLGLAQELAAARRTLNSIAEAGMPEAAFEALEAGALNHLLTTAELLAAYFPGDEDLALLTESYSSAVSLLRLELAIAGIAVFVPRYLGGGDPEPSTVVERFDRRELRRIPEIAAAANRAGDRLGYDAVVVVDCIVPGWRGPAGKRAATVIAWQRAAWRAP